MFFGKQQHLLHDQQIVRVFLPRLGAQPLPLQGVVKLVSTSFVEILFPLELFPTVPLDPAGEWLVIWEKGENILSARGRCVGQIEPSRVRLEITGFYFQTSARRYPRVDAEVYLKYWATERPAETLAPAVRQQVDISGCGLSFCSAQAYAVGAQVGLEISLPGPTLEVVRCVGRVVTTRPKDEVCFDIALEIVQIPQSDLDKVLNFCMVEQFKQLHSKVRIMGTVLSPWLETLLPAAAPVESGSIAAGSDRERP